MIKQLPARPDLQHLRKQAKRLLAGLAAGDPASARVFQAHLPAARGLSLSQITAAGYRLADAQSAIARKTGFSGWSGLARHVDELRALEGSWGVASLELEGNRIARDTLEGSRLSIDGDRFRLRAPLGSYEGVFVIDVEADPYAIDIEYVAGSSAGETSLGIFARSGDELRLCLGLAGRPRPRRFATTKASGHALEILRRLRTTGAVLDPPRPVPAALDRRGSPAIGGEPPASVPAGHAAAIAKLQGDWVAVQVIRDGVPLPAPMLASGTRRARGDEVIVTFGARVMLQAIVRIDTARTPMTVDYHLTAGSAAGGVQLGIMEWRPDGARFCFAGTGGARPTEFASAKGSGWTLSEWHPAGAPSAAPPTRGVGRRRRT